MLRIRLTTLLWLTAFASAYFFVAQRLGYLHTAVLSAVLGLVVWSLLSRLGRWFLIPRFLVFLSGVIVLWIGGVDAQRVYSGCSSCGHCKESVDLRVLGFVVRNYYEEDHSDAIYFALTDLGWVCKHPDIDEWISHRYWGTVFCGYLCFRGTLELDTGFLYTSAVSNRVKELKGSDPELVSRLRKRYFTEKDQDYFWHGLLVDWRTLAAYDEGKVREARDWLLNAPADERKQIIDSHSEITAEYIDALYDDGATEVILIWQSLTERWSKPGDIYGWLVLRLPTDEQRRSQVFRKINEQRAADGYNSDLEDYGQQFAYPYR